MQVVENDLIQLLLNLLGLSKNDVALTFDGLGFELRVLQNIGENIDGLWYIGVESPREVDGALTLH